MNPHTLHMIYHGIFSPILTYGSQIWGQQNSFVNKLQIIQNKAIGIINFPKTQCTTRFLYKKYGILMLADYINLQNFLFVYDSLNNNLPSAISGQLRYMETSYNTRNQTYHQLSRYKSRTVLYGSRSIKSKSIDLWNFILKKYHKDKFHEKS